jgi:ATP-dependent Clp protease protease subunit
MLDKDILNDVHNFGCNLSSREIFLHNHYGSDEDNPGVEYKMANTFIKNLRILNQKSTDQIIIHMHSVGGEWSDGMAIYDAIRMSRCYVTIVAYGQVESMSSIIFQAADARYLTPHTYFMSHFGSTAASGEYQNVQNWIKYEKQICDIMLDIYAKRCTKGAYFEEKYQGGQTMGKVKNFLNTKLKSGDWYINAEEAVHYGFADKIIDTWQKLG